MATTISLSDLLGKRALLKVAPGSWSSGNVEEYRVLELSPDSAWVRLMNTFGHKNWVAVVSVSFVSALQDLISREDKPKQLQMSPTQVLLDWVVSKRFYALDDVKDAFFSTFMYRGHVFFGLADGFDESEKDCLAKVEEYWKDFLVNTVLCREQGK